MKKRAARLLALLLIAGLLAGCGSMSKEELVGTWTASWTYEDRQFDCSLELKEDGSFVRTVYESGYLSTVERGAYELKDGVLVCRLNDSSGGVIQFSISGSRLKNGLGTYKKAG